MNKPLIGTALGLVLASPLALAGGLLPLTVGPGGDCNFANLQAAIDAAADGQVIQIADSNGYLGGTYQIHNKGLTLRGGFANCSLGIPPNGRTTLNAQQAGPVIDVFTGTSTTARSVILENLHLTGGRGAIGGGLVVEGRPGVLRVELRNVEIRNNEAPGVGGGGVRLVTTGLRFAPGPMLSIDNDSQILRNRATGANGYGGGLLCENSFEQDDSVLLRVGSTLFFENEAVDGGAMAFRSCRGVRLHNGGPFLFILPTGGIVKNTASGRGGGLFVDAGSEVELTAAATAGGFGDFADAGLISLNQAAIGAGFYVGGNGSELSLVGTRVQNNLASTRGGGGAVENGGQLSMREFLAAPCLPNQSSGGLTTLPPCSTLDDNRGGGEGGALAIRDGATASLRNTYVRDNEAGSGTALSIRADSANATATLEGVQLTGNRNGLYPLFLGSANGHRAEADLRFSTVARNISTGSVVRSAAGSGSVSQASFRSSIVYQPGLALVSTVLGGTHVAFGDCVIGGTSLGASNLDLILTRAYSEVDPRFRNPDGGDFRLQPDSPAIDYCDDLNLPTANDLDGRLRGELWQGPAPLPAAGAVPGGRYDLGAFEAQLLPEALFADGFE